MKRILLISCLAIASNVCTEEFSLYHEQEYTNIITQLLQEMWPEEKPNVSMYENSLMSRSNITELNKIFSKQHFSLIVELGSWVGVSTKFFLQKQPNAHVIAIDHWKGGVEHQGPHNHLFPVLYETFLVNCWQYKDRLIPLRTTTLEGMEYIKLLGLQPDLFYVDASHSYDSVTADLEYIYQNFPNAMITGDDWDWSNPRLGWHLPVRKAVQAFAKKHEFKIHAKGNFWRLYR